MRKNVSYFLLSLSLALLCSCAAPGKQPGSENASIILSGDENSPIEMFRTRDMKKEPFFIPEPGTKAKVLRNFCPEAALIHTPDGKTGWIKCGHIQ